MSDFDVNIDASGLNCPLPVLKARKALASMTPGQTLQLVATDPGASKDIPAFCKMTGNPLLETSEAENTLYFLIEKGAS
jgi:tRNA 2-thiouridine synthesizing protein A